MRDLGIQKPFIQEIDPTKKEFKNYYGLRKLFRDYLTKLKVAWFDPCCPEASDRMPVSFTEGLERFNPTSGEWETIDVTIGDDAAFSTLVTNTIGGNDEQLQIISNPSLSKGAGVAIDATATATAADVVGGLITSTSAAAVALTLPSATAIATEAGGLGRGGSLEFFVDNSQGANTVTVTLPGSITAVTAVVTGSATLTVASGAVGVFRLIFLSGTAAKIARMI